MAPDMNMTVQVQVREAFGVRRWYPMCDRAILLTRLTGCTTFTRDHIATLRRLGYEFHLTDKHGSTLDPENVNHHPYP